MTSDVTTVIEILGLSIQPPDEFETWTPEDPLDVGMFLEVYVGFSESEGGEMFRVFVCTPRYVERQVRINGPLIARHHVIVEKWDATAIELFLRGKFAGLDATDFPTTLETLSRIGRWEDEDYVDDSSESDQFHEITDKDLPVPPKDMEAFFKEHSYRPKPTTEP